MINTYTTSYVPPPVPPRLGGRAPSKGCSASLVWFLSTMLAIHMAGCLAAFVYLYHRSAENTFQGTYHEDLMVLRRLQECEDGPSGSTTLLDCKKILDTYKNIVAKVLGPAALPWRPKDKPPASGACRELPKRCAGEVNLQWSDATLRWNREHSLLVNVDYLQVPSTLKIRAAGDYYVYSQVTFSQKVPRIPLVQRILRRRTSNGEKTEDVLLQSFCGMKGDGEACTSFQGGVFRLEKGQELLLDVSRMSLLNFDPTATTFGLFMV
uniref:CD40 ligand n=1 Tax=Scleropages formosus TaxID=113540 RepID=A0A8D0CLE7_SCLFO